MTHSKRKFNRSSPNAWKAPQPSITPVSPHRSLAGLRGFAKRTIDICSAASGLIVLFPLLTLVAIAVVIDDRGPLFYRQARIGLGGRPFTIVKFRTMAIDAEQHLGAIWAVPDDPRCTRLGRYLRRFGIDELPQLWNILRGDMSLIGPRPERPEFTRKFRKQLPLYEHRHSVRPGLTGYAQIHGWRGFTAIEERLRHDLYYVRNWSLALDLRILAMTMIHGWSERTRDGIASKE